jgi:hypothetical protein
MTDARDAFLEIRTGFGGVAVKPIARMTGRPSITMSGEHQIEFAGLQSPQRGLARSDPRRGRPHRGLCARSARSLGTNVSTLQERLPKELKLAGSTSVAPTIVWLSENDIAMHNTAFAVSRDQET